MNGYLFAGYATIIVLIFGYLAYLQGKLGRLARELEALREDSNPPGRES